MRVITTFVCVLFITFFCRAQQVNIIPQPVELKLSDSKEPFIINKQTKFVFGHGMGFEKYTDYFNDYLLKHYGFKLKVYDGPLDSTIKSNYITMSVSPLPGGDRTPGKYGLTVNKNSIRIGVYRSDESLFYAMQTLIQLLPVPNIQHPTSNIKLSIPQLTITDYPRFAWRGLHFDVSRHFFPVDYIKKYIDYIALHKMNYFHWHLTDDQGWRIEIKKYPKLTSVGAWRDGTIIGRYPGTGNDNIHYGGFYTQEEIKDVVKYAAERYITIIPEIEMPGHSMAALAAYPQLGTWPDSVYKVSQTWGINGVYNNVLNPSEYTFNFFQDVLDEVMQLFPSPYIHIGGDECSKKWWHESAFCQQLMKEKGIKDEDGLQSYFIQRMEKYINSKGKKIIGWDEILEGGLAPNATVMSWQGEKGGIEAAKQNHDVIMTPGNPVYFDHTQSQNEDSVTIGGYNPIEKVYAYEPIPKELNAEQSKYVLGAQANMWTEYMGNTRKVEYMLFPRLSALSEVLWSPKENRNWDDFQKRLLVQFKRYDLWRANYSKAYFDLHTTILPTDNSNAVLWKLESKQPGTQIKYITHYAGRPYELAFSEGTAYTTPVEIRSTMLIAAIGLINGKPVSNPVYETFHFNKATGKKITLAKEASEKYPGDGSFTLVNGVINEKGFTKSREFLGFNGTNCEAIIDLGILEPISYVVVNTLNRPSSWIWRPLTVEALGSGDGINWYSLKLTDDFEETKDGTGKAKMTMSFKATYARYVKVVVTNWGTIPEGNPGAGNKPWLFVDEIEVNGP
jgi:hexosaminidase